MSRLGRHPGNACSCAHSQPDLKHRRTNVAAADAIARVLGEDLEPVLRFERSKRHCDRGRGRGIERRLDREVIQTQRIRERDVVERAVQRKGEDRRQRVPGREHRTLADVVDPCRSMELFG